MALYRKLTEGWRLTDGILPEMEMDKPMCVYEALRAAKRLPDAAIGMNAMACEWIAARRWTYTTCFEAPDEGDDRIYIELPGIAGGGEAYLNGEHLGAFDTGAVRLELTGKIRTDEENRLELRFAPAMYLRPENALPVPRIGLLCEPVLRAVNYVTVERIALSSRMDGEHGVIQAALHLDVHADGKYTFRYGLVCGDEPAGQQEIHEHLVAGKKEIVHEIRVDKPVRLDNARMEETVYGVKFSLERGGVGCEVRHMETAMRKNMNPMRCFSVKEWPVGSETVGKMLALGAEGVLLSGQPENAFEKNDFLGGLTVLKNGECMEAVGAVSDQKLREYAADEKCWPLDAALWRLRGGETGEADADAIGAEPFVRAMRLQQAQRVFESAAKARRERRAVIAPLDEEYAWLAGPALMEKDGQARPALGLLTGSWREAYACCELPEGGHALPDTLLHLNVWTMAEELTGRILSASVRVMNMRGQEIASTVFPVMGGDVRMAGVINVRTPSEAGLLIVRTELTDSQGGLLRRTDGVLAVGRASAVCLMGGAEEVLLTETECGLRNDGERAAVGAGACLMPGEETGRKDMEWLNAKVAAREEEPDAEQ